MFDPQKVTRQSHPNWRYPAAECETVWNIYRPAQVVLATNYDQLLALYNGLIKSLDEQCSIGCLCLPSVREFVVRPENGQESK